MKWGGEIRTLCMWVGVAGNTLITESRPEGEESELCLGKESSNFSLQ